MLLQREKCKRQLKCMHSKKKKIFVFFLGYKKIYFLGWVAAQKRPSPSFFFSVQTSFLSVHHLLRKKKDAASKKPQPFFFFEMETLEVPISSLSAKTFWHANCDKECFDEEIWQDQLFGGIDLNDLTQETPTFPKFDENNILTHAVLCVTQQPGVVFLPSSKSNIGEFRVQLLPHPALPSVHPSKPWKIGPLKVSLASDMPAAGSKKRRRTMPLGDGDSTNSTRHLKSLGREYAFQNMDTVVSDIKSSPTSCKPISIYFECTVEDALGRTALFSTLSRSFIVSSNCIQWIFGFANAVKNLVFANGTTGQVPFPRLFNYLQLAYLHSKGFEETRYLTEREIRSWINDFASTQVRMERDYELFHCHDTVSMALFLAWIDAAAVVFYDLHTAAVGKVFQNLWVAGFVGFGKPVPIASVQKEQQNDVICKLVIDTTFTEWTTRESYLLLAGPISTHKLLALERDHLDYFLQCSKNALGCTHLIGASQEESLLSVESINMLKKY